MFFFGRIVMTRGLAAGAVLLSTAVRAAVAPFSVDLYAKADDYKAYLFRGTRTVSYAYPEAGWSIGIMHNACAVFNVSDGKNHSFVRWNAVTYHLENEPEEKIRRWRETFDRYGLRLVGRAPFPCLTNVTASAVPVPYWRNYGKPGRDYFADRWSWCTWYTDLNGRGPVWLKAAIGAQKRRIDLPVSGKPAAGTLRAMRATLAAARQQLDRQSTM